MQGETSNFDRDKLLKKTTVVLTKDIQRLSLLLEKTGFPPKYYLFTCILFQKGAFHRDLFEMFNLELFMLRRKGYLPLLLRVQHPAKAKLKQFGIND